METESDKNNSKLILALVLIGIGALLLLRKMAIYYDFPGIHIERLFFPFKNMIQGWSHIIFSWQMVLILIGLVLIAGKRSFGLVLLIAGGIFLLPELFFFTGVTFSLLIPLFLIVIGVALIARIIR